MSSYNFKPDDHYNIVGTAASGPKDLYPIILAQQREINRLADCVEQMEASLAEDGEQLDALDRRLDKLKEDAPNAKEVAAELDNRAAEMSEHRATLRGLYDIYYAMDHRMDRMSGRLLLTEILATGAVVWLVTSYLIHYFA